MIPQIYVQRDLKYFFYIAQFNNQSVSRWFQGRSRTEANQQQLAGAMRRNHVANGCAAIFNHKHVAFKLTTTAILVLSFLILLPEPCTSFHINHKKHRQVKQEYVPLICEVVHSPIVQLVKLDRKTNRWERSFGEQTQIYAGSSDAWKEANELSENQALGEAIIRQVGTECGADNLKIEWSKFAIKIVVLGDAFISNPMNDEEDGNYIEDDYNGDNDDGTKVVFAESLLDNNLNFTQQLDGFDNPEENLDGLISFESPSKGVDVAVLARAINAALKEHPLGQWMTETFEIEVTTPGAPDELSGIMWKVYQGFPVTCRHRDPKTMQEKTVEGRLHERTDEFTVININGRMKKLKNDNVLSVKLPKAKKEKGSW